MPISITSRQRWHVALLVLVAGALGAGFSLLMPLFLAPDEPAHADAVLQLVGEGGYLTGGSAHMSLQIAAAQHELQTTEPLRPDGERRRFVAEDATPRPERPTFDDLASTADGNAPNYVANHPPLYYLMTGVVARTAMSVLPEHAWSFDRELLLMRFVNVGLLMATTALTYVLARVMGLGHLGSMVAMVLPLGVPQYLHIGGSINSDNLYIAASTAFVVTLVLIARQRPSSRLALLTGCAGSLVVLSKAQGLVALLVLGALAAWFALRPRRSLTTAGLLLLPPLVLTAPMLMSNMVRTGTISPRETAVETAVAPVDVAAWVGQYLQLSSRTFWGAFGWLDAALPANQAHVLSVVGSIAVLAALTSLVVRAQRWILVPWAFAALAAGLPIAASLSTHLSTGAMRAMQGRYLYPALPLAACTVLLAARALARRWPAVALVGAAVTSAAIGILYAGSVQVILARHWGPTGASVRVSYAALRAWSPLPNVLTIAVTGVALVAALVAVLAPSVLAVRWYAASRRDAVDTPPNLDGPPGGKVAAGQAITS